MEFLLLLLLAAAVVLVVRYAFKKKEAEANNEEFAPAPVDFVKEEVKTVLDVNNDGKVDLGNVKEVVAKGKKAIRTTKAVVKKTPGRKKKNAV